MPAPRLILIAGMLMVAAAGIALPALAQSGGTAMPATAASSAAQTGPITGQGQAAYPSSSTETASTVASSVPTITTPAIAAVPSVASPSPQLVSSANHPTGQDDKPVTVSTVTTSPGQQPAVTTTTVTPNTTTTTSTSGITIPSPPPPSAFNNDPNQLAAQAEQAAIQAQAQADADEQKREQEHNAKSYDRASNGLLPMNPDQVREFMHKLEQTQNAAQFPYEGVPKGQTRVATLSLDPGVEPPQINLATGYVTTITMVDSTGEPWPILDVGVGGNFEVSPTQAGTHVVRVMPLTRVGVGDLSVLLKDCPTPVIFRLAAGGPTVDLRYDARIGKAGPGAKPQIINRPRIEAGDESLTQILENAPPESAKRLKVAGLDTRTKAWSIGDKVYVRTPLSLLSPAWNASVASEDGTTFYEMGDAPVLLMSDNGAMIRAQISRDDDHDK